MPVVSLAEYPVVATEYGRWQPLNSPLEVTGFGINAMVCDPGEEFDIEHTEEDSGQQEAYIVVSGAAVFTIDGEETEAPAGTVVSVPNSGAVRSYRASAPGTRIVCVGGSPTGEPVDFGTWITEAAAG
jgi:mannose-6-phosphate isomerase-like protein (cupin superfamily)